MDDIARETALRILNAFDKKNLTLDTIVEDYAGTAKRLSKLDRSLINSLVFGALRWRGKIDYIISHFSKTPLKKIRPDILNILRIGIFQIIFMTRIPDSAAVNTSVNLAKKSAPAWICKFVNAILRNIAGNPENLPFPSVSENTSLAISVEKSFPEWLVQRWLNRYGTDETIQICDAMNSIPVITLRTNTLKTDRDTLAKALDSEVEDLIPTKFSPIGLSVTQPLKPIPELTAFKKGWFQVQDEAAQAVSMLLNPSPGERILDACAGLGGKTGHIAQIMENRGEILAIDSVPEKLKRLENEMERLGITTVRTKTADLNSPVDISDFGLFDKILVDAPCSGLGVLRRNPDGKWSQSKKNLNRFRKRQVRFLNNLKVLLKPGGRIIYAVCSTEPEEGRGVIDSFLNSSPEFSETKELPETSSCLSPLAVSSGAIATMPHRHNMDGFFAASLLKQP